MKEQVAVWQGECGGYLVVDFRYRPRPADELQGPRTRPKKFQVITGDMEGPSTALVGLGALKRRLQAALSGVIRPQGRYALKKRSAKKRAAKRSAKAKAKARTTRTKK